MEPAVEKTQSACYDLFFSTTFTPPAARNYLGLVFFVCMHMMSPGGFLQLALYYATDADFLLCGYNW